MGKKNQSTKFETAMVPKFYYPVSTEQVKRALSENGCALIHELPIETNCGSLLDIARSIGNISANGIGLQSNMQIPSVHRIEPLTNARKDRSGRPILSTTHLEMRLHTDDYFSEKPTGTVLLHCHTPGEGGNTTLKSVREIVQLGAESLLTRLEKSIFPSPFGNRPILYSNRTKIKYNYDAICKLLTGNETSKSEIDETMEEFNQFLAQSACVLTLKKRDCIVIDNETMLHGRTKIDPQSYRLLFRVRVS